MINYFLRKFIETGDVAVFINDVIVEIVVEEGHDEIIEEILKKNSREQFIH